MKGPLHVTSDASLWGIDTITASTGGIHHRDPVVEDRHA
jgi:hypothetical protein